MSNDPAYKLGKLNPELSAIISKLVKDKLREPANTTNRDRDVLRKYRINQAQVFELSKQLADNITDNQDLIELFPDIELSIQILVSSILSPKDIITTQLEYTSESEYIPPEVSLKLLDIIKEHLDKEYGLEGKLGKMLEDMLFYKGAYIEAILPESTVDDLINNPKQIATEGFNIENIVKPLGFLGTDSDIALEAYNKDTKQTKKITVDSLFKLNITDNYDTLKITKVLEQYNHLSVRNTINKHISKENNDNLIDVHDLYKDPDNDVDPVVTVLPEELTTRRSIAKPLILNLPMESTIPVYKPGEPSKHIGYFIVLDHEGYPITKEYYDINERDLDIMLRGSKSSVTQFLIRKAKDNLSDRKNIEKLSIQQATTLYGDIVEAELERRLKEGVYKTQLKVSRIEDIYKLMLARSLSNRSTKILYIPVELLTYFTFNTYSNGIGKSLLDDLRIISSMRAILLFAKVMGMVKNSISVTNVNLQLSEHDPDPLKTIEILMSEVLKTRQQYFPLGINKPMDLVDWIHRAGFNFTFEGHPGLPETKIEFDTNRLQHELPDDELEETLRKRSIMHFSLSPEVVDNGFAGDFATSITSNNILFSKRVIKYQQEFLRQLDEHVKKIINYDRTLKDKCINILKQSKDILKDTLPDELKNKINLEDNRYYTFLFNQFTENLETHLPTPNINKIEIMSEAYRNFEDALERVMAAWIDEELFNEDLTGEFSRYVTSLKNIAKSYFLRQWQAENGYFNELADMVMTDDEGKPVMDFYEINKNHINGIVEAFKELIVKLHKSKQQNNEELSNLNTEDSDNPAKDNDSPWNY